MIADEVTNIFTEYFDFFYIVCCFFLSETLEKRIQDRLGCPQTDPFGQPIPGSGYREPRNVVTLDKAPIGKTMVVDRIPEDDAELVAYLHENGVLPGVEVVVSDVAPYRGVVTLLVGDESRFRDSYR